MINELKERLFQIFSIDNSVDINKFYEELLSFFSESQNEFIIRRHKELKKEGYNNKDIFPMLVNEVKNHLFKGQLLTERQVKRIIYKE